MGSKTVLNGTFWDKINSKVVEMAGVEPASCDDVMTTYYTLVPFLLLIVLLNSQWTDFSQTGPSEISRKTRKVKVLGQDTVVAPLP